MIQLPLNNNMVNRAIQKAQMLGHLNNSITKGQANAAGYLGEESLAHHLGIENLSNDDDKFNRDLVLPNGRTIEVKTKRRTVDPLPIYDVSVAESSKHQKPDIYAFISITFGTKIGDRARSQYDNPLRIWLCGYYPSNLFWQKAKQWNSKMFDDNGYIPIVNHYNLRISELYMDLEYLTE